MPNEIYLYGTVGASFWDEEYFTAKTVRELLDGRSGALTVRINSGGGIATEGQAIYTLLKDYPGEVAVVVDGVAASAASLIAMAGDTITMRLGSWMLIHDPAQMFGYGRGTADDHRELAGFLDKVGDAYAEVYASRTGKTLEAARDIMRAETVYLGSEAVTEGFATDYEGSVQSAAAASFDYRLYAHAPVDAREASERLGLTPDRLAIVAAIAGFPLQKGVQAMPDPITPAPVAPIAAVPPVAPVAPVVTLAPVLMSAVQASKLHQMASRLNVDAAVVAKAVEDNLSFEAALDAVNAAWKMGTDDLPMHGRPTARIMRDERDTRREGMTVALHAQMARKAPAADTAREFMEMSIVDMAAICADHRGPIRNAGERIRVIEAASHSTSDFPAIFENALNKRLADAYVAAAPTYREFSMEMPFNDFRPHPVANVSEYPTLLEIKEGGEIKFGTISEKKETVSLASYGRGLTVSRQMLINDDLMALDRVINTYGQTVAAFEDATFYAMMISGSSSNGPTLVETGRQVFNTTDLTRASSGGAIDVTTVSAGRAGMRKKTSLSGQDVFVVPSILLVGPDYETIAEQLVAPIQAQQASNVNPLSGRLRVVVTAKITGNAWYLLSDPSRGSNFMYGFLQGQGGPRLRMEEPFGTQGTSFTVEHDFGCGAVDFRFGYKNPGA
ncbi:MAG: head maturation protease, ClpP-related [Pseudomonadota bacterium]